MDFYIFGPGLLRGKGKVRTEPTLFKLNRTVICIASLTVLVLTILLIAGCVPANIPPTIANLQAEQEIVPPSHSCQIACEASDPDGDKLSYTWSASGGKIAGRDAVIIWTAPETPGIYTIAVKVIDEMGGEGTSSLSIKVVSNNPPTVKNLIVTAKEARYFEEYPEGYRILKGNSCDIVCIASDPDNDGLTYEWLTTGGNISGEGHLVTWVAPLRGGEVTVTVTVSDRSDGIATKSTVFKVETCACWFE